MVKNTKTLCAKLGYDFKDPHLLEAALTHRSIRGLNNERLEFLGDSILNFIIAAALFQQFPTAKEGDLSRLRANLVKGDTLAELAQEFELGNYLKLGAGELKSGGYRRKSILADALEAIIGAIYLDGGMAVCQERLLRWYESRLQETSRHSGLKDPKTRLQEYLQAKKVPLPNYSVLSIQGEAHKQTFRVACKIEKFNHITEGVGSSRRSAEQEAAQKYLEYLEQA